MARRLVAARLITLMKLLYKSAGPAYRRATRLSDFEWRVVMQVGDKGPIALTALAALLGQDKGQLSHAVRGLVQSKLLSRQSSQAPIALTARGRAVFDRILNLSRTRNTALVRQLTDAERRAAPQLLLKLEANARVLLDREQATKSAPDDVGSNVHTSMSKAPSRAARPDGERAAPRLVAQDLFAVHSLVQRSAAMTYRRETGLSDFEWRVLTQVGEHAPLTLIELVPMLSRDKSQVGRTLASLEARGLITRHKIGGGRHVRVDISDRGRQVYARLAELASFRNSALVQELSAREQQTLLEILDKLTAAATSLLDG